MNQFCNNTTKVNCLYFYFVCVCVCFQLPLKNKPTSVMPPLVEAPRRGVQKVKPVLIITEYFLHAQDFTQPIPSNAPKNPARWLAGGGLHLTWQMLGDLPLIAQLLRRRAGVWTQAPASTLARCYCSWQRVEKGPELAGPLFCRPLSTVPADSPGGDRRTS